MSKFMLCILCFIVALVAIGIFIVLGRNSGAQKGQLAKDAMESYRSAETWDQKLVAIVFNVVLLLKAGFWGFLGAVSIVILHTLSTICGPNPWPYYFELWDRITGQSNDTPPLNQSADPAL